MPDSHCIDAKGMSVPESGAKAVDKRNEEVVLECDWSKMPEPSGFKFSDIQDVFLLRTILRKGAHLASDGQKIKAFEPVFLAYQQDSVSTNIIGGKHPTANSLHWRLIVLMRYRLQYLYEAGHNNGSSTNIQNSSDDHTAVKMTKIHMEKTRLIDQVLEERRAAGLPPPVTKQVCLVEEQHTIPKKHLRSQNRVSAEIHDKLDENHIEALRDVNDFNDDMNNEGVTHSRPSRSDPLAENDHSRFETNEKDISFHKNSRRGEVRQLPLAVAPPSLPIANPFLTPSQQIQFSRHRDNNHPGIESMKGKSNIHIRRGSTENDRLFEATEVNGIGENQHDSSGLLNNEANAAEVSNLLVYTSGRNGSDRVFKRRYESKNGECHGDLRNIRKSLVERKHLRFHESHSPLDSNSYDRTQHVKRRRLTGEDISRPDSDQSTLHSSPNYNSLVQRPLSSSPTTMAEVKNGLRCSPLQSPLPPSIPAPPIAPPLSPVSTPKVRLSPGNSRVPSPFEAANCNHSTSRHSAVAPPSTNCGSLHRVYGTGKTTDWKHSAPPNRLLSLQLVETVPHDAQHATPNNVKRSKFGSKHAQRGEQETLDMEGNDFNDRATPGAMVQADGKDCYSQSVLSLMQELVDIEKVRLSREKEEYALEKHLLRLMERRVEIDIRRLNMEEHDLKRSREVERRRLEMEERDFMIRHDLGERDLERRQELQRERLQLERDEFAQLAEERCARRQMDQRQIDLGYDLRRRALEEHRTEIEAMQQLFTAMHDARTQHRAKSNLGDLWKNMSG